MNLYFKYHWNETSGDPLNDDWGTSDWYFETNSLGDVLRQAIVYENGRRLFYDEVNRQDAYGFLTDQAMEPDETGVLRICRDEFETVWKTRTA